MMENKILVTYATKYGATAEIAEKISQVMGDKGFQIDVLHVKDVNDLTTYTAVVLGSAVYILRWRREAVRFLKTNEKLLTERPVWIFSSGPTEEEGAESPMKDWRFPKGLQPVIERIKPRDIKVFRGNVDTKKLNLIEKLMIRMVKAPVGDFRDWDAITAWAETIADGLNK
jgi:menaquinone-dependent protoporphyrinogen oxidase